MTRALAILTGTLCALAIFALAEAVHFVGMNPFEPPAAVAAHSPALTTDRAGMGSRP